MTSNISDPFINFEDIDDYWQAPQSQVKKDAKDLLLEAIKETEETITKAVTNQVSIQKDFEKSQKEAKHWSEKAQIALKNNDDDLAFQAVLNKKIQNKIALTIQTQLQQQEITINLLVQNLMVLEQLKEILCTVQNQDSISNTQLTIDFNSNTELIELKRQLDNL